MNKTKKLIIWVYMLTKKLFHRWSFIFLLAMIPLIIPILNNAMNEESSVVKIALCNESEGDIADDVIKELTNEKTIVGYEVFKTDEEAIDAVSKNECNAAWIFEEDFEKRMNMFLEEESIRPFVKIVEQEDSISLMLAREKLFGKLYSHFAYKIFSDFIKNDLLSEKSISDEEIRQYYNAQVQTDKLIEIKMIGSNAALNTEDANYLKTPLRGIFALLIMLCGFAAAGFFLKERSDGVYDWLSSKAKMMPAFGSCFAAIIVSSVTVVITIFVGGLNVSVITELCSMFVYVFAATAFCTFLTACFKNFTKFGPVIPFLMIVMLVVCPIFFSFRFWPWLRFSIPPYYYLMSVYSFEYVWYMALYTVLVMVITYIMYSLKRY